MVGELRDPLEGQLGRVLILLAALPEQRPVLRGLSRLSRLDFLLRYPVVLERVADLAGVQVPGHLRARADERVAVESNLLRWKFGGYEKRYQTMVGQLVGRQIAELVRTEAPAALRLTATGAQAQQLLVGQRWSLVRGRARLIATQLPPSGRQLGELIEGALAREPA